MSQERPEEERDVERPSDSSEEQESGESIEGEWIPASEEAQRLVRAEAAYFYQGPLPSPEQLQGYEEIVPGSAERIIGRLEGETEHRHGMERRGQYIAGGIAGAGLLGGFALIMFNHDVAGAIFTASGIGPIVYAFLRTRGGLAQQNDSS